MKKETNEEKKLTWKLKELPSAGEVSSLVETGVITKDEAREILFRQEVKQSDDVEALKEMVETLQGMVKDLLSRPNVSQIVPFTKVVEVPRRLNPYWEKYWISSSGATIEATAGNQYTTNYTLSIM